VDEVENKDVQIQPMLEGIPTNISGYYDSKTITDGYMDTLE
jgi:hypothetical protein